MMMDNHEAGKSRIEKDGPAHYIEVVAVRPDQQGQGMGGKMMRHILSQIGSAPVYLECTDASNIKFYERYGFSVVKETELVSVGPEKQKQILKMWLMVRK